MPDNRPDQWSSLAKTLHWLTVFLVLLEIPAGFLMSYTYPLSLRDKQGLAVHQLAGQIHHTNGFLILALVIGRLAWRCVKTAPRALQAFQYERLLATISHFGLYALLIVLPLSGWAALSVFGEAPIWFFDYDHLVPAILAKRPVDSPHGYGFFAGIHVWSYEIGAVILIAHIGAAFWHYFVRRDHVFQGMWPLARKDG
jgi:cytochrome b561